MADAPKPPPECAQCGAEIPPRARACPECGADERTGWRESSVYDGLELPDEAWHDDDAPDSSSAGGRISPPLPSRQVNGLAWYWWCLAVALLCLLGLWMIGLR